MALVEDEHPLLMVQAMEGSRPSEVHNDETAALDAEALQLELNVTIDKEALKPVVIVPGLFGSQLEWKLSKSHRSPDEWCAKSTGHRFSPFWISAHRFLPLGSFNATPHLTQRSIAGWRTTSWATPRLA